MSTVHLLSAIRRETRQLLPVAESATQSGPPAVASLIRSALQDLEEAAEHLRRLLDQQAAS